MTRLPEVISTVKRRRAWSVEEKIEILEAAFSRGGSVARRPIGLVWRAR